MENKEENFKNTMRNNDLELEKEINVELEASQSKNNFPNPKHQIKNYFRN